MMGALKWADDFEMECEKVGVELGVPSAVHPEDYILHRMISGHETSAEAARSYLFDGDACALKFKNVVYDMLGFSPDKPLSLLEFASGYGRVTRHLPKRLPNVHTVACDIHPQAVDFLATRLGVRSLQSTSAPEKLRISERFDLIFALSFFTHIPDETFGGWLKALHGLLNLGGCLVFTTKAKKAYDKTGWDQSLIETHQSVFFEISEQQDLPNTEYGGMFAMPSYVVTKVWESTQAPICLLRENFWWDLQDLYVVKKV